MKPEPPFRFPDELRAPRPRRVECNEGAHVLLFTVLGAAIVLCVVLLGVWLTYVF